MPLLWRKHKATCGEMPLLRRVLDERIEAASASIEPSAGKGIWGWMFASAHHSIWYSSRRRTIDVALEVWVLLGCFALWQVNQQILKPACANAFFHHHWNDVLAPSILLSYANILVWCLTRSVGYFSKPLHAFLLIAFASCVWEYLGPIALPGKSVGDCLDIVAYFLGAIAFVCICTARPRVRSEEG